MVEAVVFKVKYLTLSTVRSGDPVSAPTNSCLTTPEQRKLGVSSHKLYDVLGGEGQPVSVH